MKLKSIIVTAALFVGVLSISSFASVIAETTAPSAPEKFEAPAPVKIVNPTGLFRRHEGATVMLSLTVDATGQPHDIKLLRGSDDNLTEKLLPVVAQWRFTPAKKNGVPVPVRIELPLQLVEGPVS